MLGIILCYILCGYPALTNSEDKECCNNIGIGLKSKPTAEESWTQLGKHTQGNNGTHFLPLLGLSLKNEHIREGVSKSQHSSKSKYNSLAWETFMQRARRTNLYGSCVVEEVWKELTEDFDEDKVIEEAIQSLLTMGHLI